jgi:hypothetical protein
VPTIYHAIGGSLQRLGRGTNATVSPTPRPTGTGYVAWETLWAAGDNLRSVVAKVRNGDVLTLPTGTFEFADFNDGGSNYGLLLPAACGGLWGSGSGADGSAATVLQMTANSSTKASLVPAQATGDTNPLFLVRSGNDGTVFKNFQLKGTAQGHLYNGLRISGSSSNPVAGGTVDGVFHNGCNPGNASSQPGETFAFSTNHTDNVQVLNCLFDGRDVGAGAGSSLIGHNSSTNTLITDTVCQYAWYGHGVTYWQCDGIHTVRLTSQFNGWGGVGGHGINHENTGGTILHESPTLKIDLTHGHGKHITVNNSSTFGYGNNPSVSLTSITHDAGPSNFNGAFYFQIGDTYQGSTQTQTSFPTVTKAGVTLVGLDSSVGGTADPARNMVRAH